MSTLLEPEVAEMEKDLGITLNSSMKASTRWAAEVKKENSILGFIRIDIEK